MGGAVGFEAMQRSCRSVAQTLVVPVALVPVFQTSWPAKPDQALETRGERRGLRSPSALRMIQQKERQRLRRVLQWTTRNRGLCKYLAQLGVVCKQEY